ncbi:hypothetical protein C1646_770365 [Rhizophagus diaphanus]|nr:hypothetical protein C1646_770365 [Rhizophagus diaphanus] [Rhizophagus sp. MUCL 43196]
MSCSKIFSGNLPELTYKVIKYFQNDYFTLHSCILVNRLWCRLAIPLLWGNSFSIPTGNYKSIEVYLINLNDDFKTKFNENKIINNSLPLNTLFNYPKFLKYLNIYKFIFSVEKWFEMTIRTIKPENRLFTVSDFIRLIDISLFKIFIENEVYLHTLEIEISDITLELLFQKSGDYLENFGYDFGFIYNLLFKQQLLGLIIKYCNNIRFLDSCGNDDQIIHLVFNLIENIKHNLNYLSISTSSYDNNRECSSIILQNLGQILPIKLEYLRLSIHHIKISDIEVFLKNSQDIFIKKLLIHNTTGQDILPSIKKYIMKKKKVKYLSIYNSYFVARLYDIVDHSSDLFSFNNEVKEFGLYNIKVQSYSSLMIRLSDFIKELD